ncbi:MAG: DNA primase [Dehalococcoidia bacterium]
MSSADEIKAKTDIVGLVGETTPLKRAGRNFSASCPFHSERTPSFFVFPDRQTWRCFGACATGGDIFSFVMRRDNVAFGDALRTLADRAGVSLAQAGASRERAKKEDILKRLNREAAMFFHETLLKADEAAAARAYLEQRGLTGETIEEFRLGFCPTRPQALARLLANLGYGEADLDAAGLVRRREDGSTYSLFRGRLIIPIFDERTDYVGFGARALDESGPKYVNSPQSQAFEKGAVLYGIHRAKDAIRQEGLAVIVEGYMDVMTAHQHGYRTVVASMGTALTERQVATLTRLAGRFVLALDPDAAGDEATLRSLESSWGIFDRRSTTGRAVGLTGPEARAAPELRVMDLPTGQDPDQLIREDPDAWEERLAAATPVIDYVFSAVVRRSDPTTVEGKTAITRRLAPLIHNAASVIEQNNRIQKLANMLKVEENVVKGAVQEVRAPGSVRRLGRAGALVADPIFSEAPRDSLEEYCLASLLRYPELWPQAALLEPEHFLQTPNREIFRCIAGGVPVEELKDHLEEAFHGELDALFRHRLELVPQGERERGVEECVERLRRRHILVDKEALPLRVLAGEITREEASAIDEQYNSELRRIDGQDPAAHSW